MKQNFCTVKLYVSFVGSISSLLEVHEIMVHLKINSIPQNVGKNGNNAQSRERLSPDPSIAVAHGVP